MQLHAGDMAYSDLLRRVKAKLGRKRGEASSCWPTCRINSYDRINSYLATAPSHESAIPVPCDCKLAPCGHYTRPWLAECSACHDARLDVVYADFYARRPWI